MTKRKQKRCEGDVIRIPLGGAEYAFGRVLRSPLFAFYDLRASGMMPPLDEIIHSPVAFKIWVMRYSITDGDFEVIGHAPLSPDLLDSPPFFKQDVHTGKLSMTYTGAEEIPASWEEVQALECAAVWEPEHVVDRLRDHFAGKLNKWAELLRPKPRDPAR